MAHHRAHLRNLDRLLLCTALSLEALACTSSDKAPGTSQTPPDSGVDAGARCSTDPALAARRDACEFGPGASPADTIGGCAGSAIPIEHVVILMQENRSFDQYFGHLPDHGQDDVEVAKEDATNPAAGGGAPIPWHHEAKYCVRDTDHGWSASHKQWNDGKMDGFATTNVADDDPTGSRAMGYYDQADIPFYYDLASTFAIGDHYFCSLLGPTYPNRLFFYGGTSYGAVTTDAKGLAPTGASFLFTELDAKGVSWKDYRTNLPSALLFTDYYTAHQDRFVPITDFLADAASGNLPAVSILDANFVDKAWLENDEHPPANVQLGQHFVYAQVEALMKSPLWPKSALFITYDEHGGLYDHVSPPSACIPDDTPPRQEADVADFDRLGFRVPLIVVSPYAKRHFVTHEVHSHTSILRFLQTKFDLPALTRRDANSDALLDVFDFDAPPNLTVPDFDEPAVEDAQIEDCKQAFTPPPVPDAGL